MDYFDTINILLIINVLMLAIYIYNRNKAGKINIYFSAFIFSGAMWIASLYFFYKVENPNLALVLGRFNFFAIIWLAYFLLQFIYEFPYKTFQINNSLAKFLFIETALLSLLTLFTPLIDQGELIAGSERVTIFGQLYFLFAIHFLSFILVSIYFFFKKIVLFNGRERVRLLYLVSAVAVSTLLGFVFNIFLPSVFSNYQYQRHGYIFALFAFIIFVYVIFVSIRKAK